MLNDNSISEIEPQGDAMRVELTLPALNRLLGGDTELEVGLRQQVVEEFAKKRIKTLINDETLAKVYEAWKLEIQGTVKRLVDAYVTERVNCAAAYGSGFGGFRDWVASVCATLVDDVLKKYIADMEVHISRRLRSELNKLLEARIGAIAEERAKAAVAKVTSARFQALVDEEIDRRFALMKNPPKETVDAVPKTVVP